MRNYIYSDLTIDLNTDRRGNVELLYDDEVIIQSIKNILATVSNERVRNPIGSSLVSYLFEPIDEDAADDIRTEIRDAILRYEPRVTNVRVRALANEDQNSYDISISLRIKNLSRPVQFNTRLRSLADSF